MDEGENYTLEEIVPIPAQCPRCKYSWVGRDAIRAPSLANCGCFWCGSLRLIPHPDYPPVVDAVTARRRGGRQESLPIPPPPDHEASDGQRFPGGKDDHAVI